MDKIDVLQKLKKEKAIAVIRMDEERAMETIDAIIQGGVNFIEITVTMKNAFDLIRHFSKLYSHRDVVIGAGTILDETTARLAIISGADFIVAPCFHKGIAQLCNLYRVPYMPGIHNPQDIEQALYSGCDILKLFPASTLEPFIIKEFKGPFPQSEFIISGKVTEDTMCTWIDHGAYAVCLGSVLSNHITYGKDALIKKTASIVDMLHET